MTELDPQGCQARAHNVVTMRLCPCWSDPRQRADWNTLAYHHGLIVYRHTLCDTHLHYFTEYMRYPFICPGCGVHFEDVSEIVLDERNIKEIL